MVSFLMPDTQRLKNYPIIWISHVWSLFLLVLNFLPNIKILLPEFKLYSTKISFLSLESVFTDGISLYESAQG